MRSIVNCGTTALALAVALLSPAVSRAESTPFLMVAQQHYAEKDGKRGVILHATADVSELAGKQCALIVHFYDRDNKPLPALKKEFSNSKGGAAVRATLAPKDDDTKATVELFVPYEALSAGRDPQELRIVSDIWDNDAGAYTAAQPYRADFSFDPAPDSSAVEAAAGQFEQQRDRIGREWLRHHRHHRHGHHRHRHHGHHGNHGHGHRPHPPVRHDPKHRPHGAGHTPREGSHRPHAPAPGPHGPVHRPQGLPHRPHAPAPRPHGPVHRPHEPGHRPHEPAPRPHGPVHRPGGPVHRPHGPVVRPHGPVVRPPAPSHRPIIRRR
jgi:hypothetical protein